MAADGRSAHGKKLSDLRPLLLLGLHHHRRRKVRRELGGLMMDYEHLVKELRLSCEDERYGGKYLYLSLINRSADAIEELPRVAKKMHLRIFLHSRDEQKAYDECGLSDEMNAALGYSGQFELRAEPPKEDEV